MSEDEMISMAVREGERRERDVMMSGGRWVRRILEMDFTVLLKR